MKKISYLALITIIIQTVLTFGLNWIFFLVYYRLNKYAFISNNSENEKISSFVLFLQKDRKKLSTISIIMYVIFMILFSLLIMLINDVNFFMILHYSLWDYIKSNFIYSLLLAIIILTFLTYSYKILIKNVYHALYKNDHKYFNNYSDVDMILFFVICFLTLGWFFLLFLFFLAMHELYLFIFNKYVNKTNYRISYLGLFSLLIILLMSLILIFYLAFYHHFLGSITIYLIVITPTNLILGYGLFELKMRLFLNNKTNLLIKDVKFQPKTNKLLLTFGISVVLVCLVISIIKIKEVNNFYSPEFNNITNKNLYCLENEVNTICRLSKEDFDPLSNKYNRYSIWKSHYYAYDHHQKYIVSHINPKEIVDEPITINYSGEELYTTPEGVLLSNSKGAYLYVQTYYKNYKDYYIPVFNIIKNLELIFTFEDDSLFLSILNNDVYKYDFLKDKLTKYKDNYLNIDTTRLMVDDLEINFYALENNIYGYHVKEDITYLEIKSENINKLLFTISYLDPFPANEILYYLCQTLVPLDVDKLKYISDYDLSILRIFDNIKHISYYNDRYYLYMRLLNQKSHSTDESYKFDEDFELAKCEDLKCSGENLVTNSNLTIDNITNVLYSDIYIESNDDFKFHDNKKITLLLEGNKTFYGDIEINYAIKTIKQYFQNQKISKETQLIQVK